MGFDIHIVAGKDKASSVVEVTGSVQHVITDDERTAFNVGDHQLKEDVKAYFGRAPNDAYLHSPTPWGDLYKRYNWPQVQTVVVAESAEILDITSKPVSLRTQHFTNSSSHTATFNVHITDTVSDTTSSTWSTGGTLTIGQKLEYNIGFAGAETSLSYSQSWGIGGEKSKNVTLGASSGASIELKPDQAVEAVLSASHGVMKVRIRYKAKLIGSTAINYNPTFKGHHFWCLPIGGVIDGHNSVVSTEDIEIDYHSNAKIEIKDAESGVLRGTVLL